MTRWMIDIEPPPFWAKQLGKPGHVDRWQIVTFRGAGGGGRRRRRRADRHAARPRATARRASTAPSSRRWRRRPRRAATISGTSSAPSRPTTTQLTRSAATRPRQRGQGRLRSGPSRAGGAAAGDPRQSASAVLQPQHRRRRAVGAAADRRMLRARGGAGAGRRSKTMQPPLEWRPARVRAHARPDARHPRNRDRARRRIRSRRVGRASEDRGRRSTGGRTRAAIRSSRASARRLSDRGQAARSERAAAPPICMALEPGARLEHRRAGQSFRAGSRAAGISAGRRRHRRHPDLCARARAGAGRRCRSASLYGARSARRPRARRGTRARPSASVSKLFVSAEGRRIDLAPNSPDWPPTARPMSAARSAMLEAAKREWRAAGRRMDMLRFETFGASGAWPTAAVPHQNPAPRPRHFRARRQDDAATRWRTRASP